jgi:hypothetical protein
VLKCIRDDQDVDPKEVAITAVKTIKPLWLKKEFKLLIRQLALYAIDLSQYGPLVALLNELANTLKQYLAAGGNSKLILIYSRQGVFELTLPLQYHFVDLHNWLDHLVRFTKDERFISLREQFAEAADKAILAEEVGDDVAYLHGSWDLNYKPKGYSLYFPPNANAFADTDVTKLTFITATAKYPSSLIIKTQWKSFLDALFAPPVLFVGPQKS